MSNVTENTAAATEAVETAEEKMARLERDNAWLKSQLAAAEKALALKHLPLPTDDQEDGDDPEYWPYAGLVAKYCAVLQRNAEYVDARTELLARLYSKETVAGAHFTVSEGAAADAILQAAKRNYMLKARLGQAEANVEAYKKAWEKSLERIDTLTARVAELERTAEAAAPAAAAAGASPFEALLGGGGDLAHLHFTQSLLGRAGGAGGRK